MTEKLSQVTIPADMVVDNFRSNAYNRINAKIRAIYTVPVASSDATDMAILKDIEANLAAGRLLLAVATLHEMENVSEYGKLLIEQGEKELKELAEEIVVLSSGAARDADDSDEAVDPPQILGQSPDEEATFARPMSGVENDMIEGKVDAEAYNELEDNRTI